jgi:hypothetical protein
MTCSKPGCTKPARFGDFCSGCASERAVRQRQGKPIDFSIYAADPVGFAKDVLRIDLWSHQRRTLEALVQHRRVSWRSCHGAGKSVTAAVAAIWWTVTRADSLCIITAPSARQVRQVLWRSIRRLVTGARTKLAPEGPPDTPELGWQLPGDRLLLGLTSDSAEKFVGLHASNVLVIADEASGVPEPIFAALKGSLTGNSRLLLISNPSQRAGEFYASFHGKAHLYFGLHSSAADVLREAAGIDGLQDETYSRELVADYGELSAVVAVKVDGNFPSSADDAVIPFALIEEARSRWSAAIASGEVFLRAGKLVLGVDVARFGDDATCIAPVRGNVALEPITYHGLDGVAVAARALEVADRLRAVDEVVTIRVDAIGVGVSVIDQLNRLGGPITVEAVNVGEVSGDETHERLRDRVWFMTRNWLKNGGCLPPDDRLAGELAAPTFGYSPRQRLKVEAKDETKKRLRRSPDRADALCLAVGVTEAAFTAADHWAVTDGSDELSDEDVLEMMREQRRRSS